MIVDIPEDGRRRSVTHVTPRPNGGCIIAQGSKRVLLSDSEAREVARLCRFVAGCAEMSPGVSDRITRTVIDECGVK